MLDIQSTLEEDHARFEASGAWSQTAIFHLIDHIHAYCAAHERHLILADIRNVRPPAEMIERFNVGVRVAEVFKHHHKIAAVHHRQHINKMAEHAAVNRGARLYVTDSVEDALDWLRGLGEHA